MRGFDSHPDLLLLYMKKKRIGILIVVIFLIGVSAFFIFNKFGGKKLASLEVNSNVNLPIFVDGEKVGVSPFTGTFSPKEVTVKIGSYETKLTLQVGIKTIVNRNFSSDLRDSYGETFSFEPTGLNEPTIAVVTNPSGTSLNIDRKFYGFTPINITTLPSGRHELAMSMEGYEPKNFTVNSDSQYKLTVFVDLSPVPAAPASVQQQAQVDLKKAVVLILKTPNDFLRVRSEPNTTSSEIARVHEGEKYELITDNHEAGWYDIKLNATQSGWVNQTYSTVEK